MTTRWLPRRLPVVVGAALAGVALTYRRLVRQPILTWGATADGNWVWSFILDECDGQTRLISRNRFRLPKLKDKIAMIPMSPDRWWWSGR